MCLTRTRAESPNFVPSQTRGRDGQSFALRRALAPVEIEEADVIEHFKAELLKVRRGDFVESKSVFWPTHICIRAPPHVCFAVPVIFYDP